VKVPSPSGWMVNDFFTTGAGEGKGVDEGFSVKEDRRALGELEKGKEGGLLPRSCEGVAPVGVVKENPWREMEENNLKK